MSLCVAACDLLGGLTLCCVDCHRVMVTDDDDMLFAQLTQLTRLELAPGAPARHLTGRQTRCFSCLVNLQELSISFEGIPASVYLHLTAIGCLTKLECYAWEDEILGLSQLHDLHFSCCQEDAFPGNTVSNLSNLTSL